MGGLVPKSDFIGLDRWVHLAAGGETPFLRSHLAALERYAEDKSAGLAGRERQMATYQRARARAAQLLGAATEEIAFVSSTSDGINLVAQSIDWRPGDNVVVEVIEYPSDVYPWLLRERDGVEVRFVGEGLTIPPGALEAAIDRRTRLVALSHVSYLTGLRHDLAAVAAAARAAGAIFVVDASHALGVVPVEARLADFLFSCTYKWQLGCTGIALAYWNRERQPDWRPRAAGWFSVEPTSGLARRTGFTPRRDAQCMTLGNPSFPGAYVVDNALGYLLDVGIERIEEHVLRLGERLRAGLIDLGLEVITPEEPARRAGNICIARADGAEFARRLEERDVLVWEGDGRVRYSVHLYNDDGDVERALEATRAVVAALR